MKATAQVLDERDGVYSVAGVVHAHTTMSDGLRPPEDLVAFAHARGLGVVCITDHHFDSWRYRFGVKVSRSSVQRMGMAPYLERIRQVATADIGPLVLPGIEVMPHYRWEGIAPFLCCQAMKTGVVYGLDDATVLDAMPMQLDGRGRSEAEARVAAQTLIDYVRRAGGLFFWSHLEEDEQVRFATARIRYLPRPDLLTTSKGYTGFGCFPHGDKHACRPGGAWDERLAATLRRGATDGPWTTGESDYHWGDSARPYENISDPTTVFLLSALTPEAVLGALRTGRMYAYRGSAFRTSLMRRFEARCPASDARAGSGQVLRAGAAPQLSVEVTGFTDGCRIRVIAAGTVLADHAGNRIDLGLPLPIGAGYACRAEMTSPSGETIMTNPIFVLPQGAQPTR